jgi:hypothetical protein
MADGFVQSSPDSTGKKVDTSELTVGANTVERQRTVIADDASAAGLAKVQNGTPGGSDYGLTVRTAGSVAVTGTFWQATQPVSGTFWQATQPVSAASLPLPSGAAADATLTGGSMTTRVTDGTNTASVKAASTAAVAADKAVVVAVSPNNSVAVTGTFWQATQPVSGTFWQATQPVSGTVTANAGTNLNTSALALDATITGGTQTTRLTDGTNTATVKAASTAAVAADKAVVVAVSPNNTIPVSGTFWQATQPVSGTVTANAGTNLNTSALALDATLTGGTQQSKITDGTNVATVKAASTAAVAADKAVVVAVSPNNSVAVTGTFWQATQPVSGTVTANAGTNLNTSALALDATLTGGTATTRITDGTNTATVKAASTAAVAADKAVVVAVSPNNSVAVTGTVTANAGTNLNTSALALDATLTGGTARAKITDGTNNAAVKAASTAVATTDPALVVAQNPVGYAASVFRLLSAAATTNSNLVKNAAGRVFKIRGTNAKASVVYLKFYNKATAPTVGTDTPVYTFSLKASDVFDIDFGALGIGFATGIGIGITGASADADTTALVAADVVGLNILYT